MSLQLRPLATQADWDAYHAIREAELWEARGQSGSYDRAHPDEHAPGNHPMLLVDAGRPVGVVRIDVAGPVAYLRRVAIAADVQGKGYGRQLLALAERFARQQGAVHIRSNVAPDAVGFYRKAGYRELAPASPGEGTPMEKAD